MYCIYIFPPGGNPRTRPLGTSGQNSSAPLEQRQVKWIEMAKIGHSWRCNVLGATPAAPEPANALMV